eukprot:m.456557 g.456557  ORF g.456557 m.456557 type:complete len:288 (+) comp21077_c0_seq1:116-979(+)
MGLIEDCTRLLGTGNLYEVLGADSGADETALKRAYHKKALKIHPDRGGDTEKFQVVSRVYHILADAEQRAVYDETGDVPDDDPFSDRPPNQTWADYFAQRFQDVTTELLDEDKRMYQGSEEERNDVKKAYIDSKGDIAAIIENVMHSSILDDEDRFKALLQEMISAGEVEAYPKFTAEPTKASKERRRKAKREAAEAEEALREIQAKNPSGKRAGKSKSSKSGPLDITAMIRANQSSRGAAFDSLFDKFAAAGEPPDLPDEAFAAVGARMGSGAKSTGRNTSKRKKK